VVKSHNVIVSAPPADISEQLVLPRAADDDHGAVLLQMHERIPLLLVDIQPHRIFAVIVVARGIEGRTARVPELVELPGTGLISQITMLCRTRPVIVDILNTARKRDVDRKPT